MLNLVVVDASGRRSVPVPAGPFTIGRAASSDTTLPYPFYVVIGHREVALGGTDLPETLFTAIAHYTARHGH